MTKFIIVSYQSGQRKESLVLTNPSIQFQVDNSKVARLPTKSIKQKVCIFCYDRIFWLSMEHKEAKLAFNTETWARQLSVTVQKTGHPLITVKLSWKCAILSGRENFPEVLLSYFISELQLSLFYANTFLAATIYWAANNRNPEIIYCRKE